MCRGEGLVLLRYAHRAVRTSSLVAIDLHRVHPRRWSNAGAKQNAVRASQRRIGHAFFPRCLSPMVRSRQLQALGH